MADEINNTNEPAAGNFIYDFIKEDIAEGGKVKISIERIRMYLKGLRFHLRTAA